eukprot:TRINITY_DN17092_c0_g2_i1.p1 TRINITY_DN17092_c0_g2~~TRINITY_DN17092_c0_g2_i1.p1  ORF type:complete len:188 (-),score=24.59 TRINITY_DN17092_c0_g2_i1:66-572(-)
MMLSSHTFSLFGRRLCPFQAREARRVVPRIGTRVRAVDRHHAHITPCVATAFAGSPTRRFSTFNVTFVSRDGESVRVVPATSGQTILEVAQKHGIDIEGACGGECACSTCHVILEQEAFDKLPEADEEEIDTLELALNVVDTSRLGCQIKLQQGRDDDIKLRLPASEE